MPGQSSDPFGLETQVQLVQQPAARVRSQPAPRIRPGRHSVNIAVSADDADVYVNGQEIIHGDGNAQPVRRQTSSDAEQSGVVLPASAGQTLPPTQREPSVPYQGRELQRQREARPELNDLRYFPPDEI
jgi:hypothetical protein